MKDKFREFSKRVWEKLTTYFDVTQLDSGESDLALLALVRSWHHLGLQVYQCNPGVPWFLPKFPLQGSPWICTFFSSSGFSRFSDSTNLKWKERWIEPQSTLSLQNTEWFLKKSHYRVVSGFVRTGLSFSGFPNFSFQRIWNKKKE